MSNRRQNFKSVENVSITPLSTQVSRLLYSAPAGGGSTVDRIILTGNISGANASPATHTSLAVCVVLLKNGETVPAMSVSDGSPMWPVTANILYQWFGSVFESKEYFTEIQVEVKGMRKMRPGDTIEIHTLQSVAATMRVRFAVTVFGKLA